MHTAVAKRVLYLSGTLDSVVLEDSALKIYAMLEENKKDWITMFITSYGGEVLAGFGLYDFLTEITKPRLQTVIVSEADSMSIMLAMAGRHRVMNSSASMLFHEITEFQGKEAMGLPDVKNMLVTLDCLRAAYAKIVSAKSNLTLTETLDLMEQEERVDAKTALKFGLVHEIIK